MKIRKVGNIIRYISVKVDYLVKGIGQPSRDFSSAFRGIFFRILKRNHCFQRNISCDQCGFSNCIYYNLFEKKFNDHLRFHPYIIEHLNTEDEIITVNYKVFGKFVENSHIILNSILQTQTAGLKYYSDYYPIKILSIEDNSGKILYKESDKKITNPIIKEIKYDPLKKDKLDLEFISPFRIKYKNSLCDKFYLKPFIRNLYQRVDFFCKYFEQNEVKVEEPDNLDPIEVKSNMKWIENPRRSGRQNQRMSLGGLIGNVNLQNLAPKIFALIKMGEIIQVGKQTTFGLGRYKIKKCK